MAEVINRGLWAFPMIVGVTEIQSLGFRVWAAEFFAKVLDAADSCYGVLVAVQDVFFVF